MDRPRFSYKAPRVSNGELRTPITFYSARVKEGLDGRDVSYERLYHTMGQVYAPSIKDMDIASGRSRQAKMTVKIRDPLASYQPDTRHFVAVEDGREKGKKWQVIDIRPDYDNRDFLVVVIGGGKDD